MAERQFVIAIMAAEPSGDWQGGALAQAIQESGINAKFYGVGGSSMVRAGVELWHDSQDCSCIGPADAIGRLTYFYTSFFKVCRQLRRVRPDVTVLIDSPAMNMRFAKVLRRLKLKSIYFIPPSAWTTSAKRLRSIHERVNEVMCIFKANANRYRALGLPVSYFGHPIVDEYADDAACEDDVRAYLGIEAQEEILAVLPGSRDQEVRHLMPVFRDVAEKFLHLRPQGRVLIPCATEALLAKVQAIIGTDSRFRAYLGNTRAILRVSRVALMSSGSATLEAAMCGVPMCICYRFGWINACLGRFLLKTGLLRYEHMGLPNLLVDERICPEFLQEEVCADKLLPWLEDLWNDTPRRRKMVADLQRVRENLGSRGVLQQLAQRVVAVIRCDSDAQLDI